jgi:hypothetical protein
MMSKIVLVRPLPGYRLHVEFADGVVGVVELADRLLGPVFQPLRDEAEFATAFVDEFGAVAWRCGADLAPDAIYHRLAAEVSA